MRTYPGTTNWPEDLHEAHVLLIRTYNYLRQTEFREFESLEARQIINDAQLAIAKELHPGYFKEVA